MKILGLREARAEFCAVLKRVARGEKYIVTRHGVAMCQILPPPGGKARPGVKIGPPRAQRKKKSARRH